MRVETEPAAPLGALRETERDRERDGEGVAVCWWVASPASSSGPRIPEEEKFLSAFERQEVGRPSQLAVAESGLGRREEGDGRRGRRRDSNPVPSSSRTAPAVGPSSPSAGGGAYRPSSLALRRSTRGRGSLPPTPVAPAAVRPALGRGS